MKTLVLPESPDSDVFISSTTRDKAEYAKAYIELRYLSNKNKVELSIERWKELNLQMENFKLSKTEQKLLKDQIFHAEGQKLRESRKKITIFQYIPEAIIGRGAFGEVYLVRHKWTDEIFALKKVSKDLISQKNQTDHVKSERCILALAQNEWVVQLNSSFQDEHFLYFVMEFVPGGDLMNLLIRKQVLSEDDARFYMAECVLAVESVHRLNYIHRDLKPDNILIDRNGHLKLADFGLCKRSEIFYTLNQVIDDTTTTPRHRDRRLLYTTVGTPDYIAPEIYLKEGYNESIDFWSLGVIFYEMIVGYTPFYAKDSQKTLEKIKEWETHFSIPEEEKFDARTVDLIKRLICSKEERIQDIKTIKLHPFFEGIDWENIRTSSAPWIPELEDEVDTRYFDRIEEESSFYPPIPVFASRKPAKMDSNFIGFDYKRQNSDKTVLTTALETLEEACPGRFSLDSNQTESETP